MSSRNVFYVHAVVVVMCLIVGMSESYSWLAWAQVLIPLVTPLLLGNIAIPFVILVLAVRERRTPGKIAAAVTLSAILTIASFYAILPLM
jgi:hypothetical protein